MRSDKTKEEEVIGEGIGNRNRRNWYQNEVDKEIKYL